MYEKFFHLQKKPFSIAPDPGFLYLSDRHRDALAHLKYGLESDGGFVLVTGEVGTGKTTLLRNLIGQVPGDIDVAFILNPRLTVRELLQTICDELGIEYPSDDQHSVKPYIDRLNKHLLRTHSAARSTVVVIDEAQNLSPAVLEQLRLLTNLETNEQKLLRIILVGQPELNDMLARLELRQLSQRITARYHLEPLKLADTRNYLAHRLTVSGGNPHLFSSWASWNIHRLAGGVPRLINIIADRALLGAYVDGKPRIDFMTTQRAAAETLQRRQKYLPWLATLGVLTLAIGGAWFFLESAQPDPPLSTPIATAIPTQSPAAIPAVSPPKSEIPEAPETPPPAPPVAAIPTPITDVFAGPSQALPQPIEGRIAHISQRHAFATLFGTWSIDYQPNSADVPCDFAVRYQLQCTRRRGSWDDILRLNVPVILELRDSAARAYYITALETRGTRVLVEHAQTQYRIELSELNRAWFGAFFALWPMPDGYRGGLRQGANEPAVRELRKLLGTTLAQNFGDSARFDSTLHRALLRFQQSNGLEPDGIAGPATWLVLHRAADYDIPELSRRG